MFAVERDGFESKRLFKIVDPTVAARLTN